MFEQQMGLLIWTLLHYDPKFNYVANIFINIWHTNHQCHPLTSPPLNCIENDTLNCSS